MSLITALLAPSAVAPPSGRSYGGSSSFMSMLGLDDPRESWMRQATAWACVTLISDSCALLPKKIVRMGDKSRKEVREPRFRSLWHKPNPDSLPMTFWNAMFLSLAVRGKAFAWRSSGEFWFLHPNRVEVKLDENGRKIFVLDGQTRLSTDQVLHVVGETTDGVDGISVVEIARRTIEQARLAEAFGTATLSEAAVPPGVLTTDQPLTREQSSEMRELWNERHAGGKGGVAILGRGAKFEAINWTPEQLQFISSRQLAREEIVQLWRVPPHLLGLIDKPSTWGSGIEQLGIGFVRYTLMPWIIRAEEAITYDILPDDMQYKFVVQALERADLTARFESYKKGREMGVYSADEIRELEDMAPRDVSDDYLSPMNYERMSPGQAGRLAAQPAIAAIAGAIRDYQTTEVIGETPYPVVIEAELEDLTETEQMAAQFLEGRSYGQIAIAFSLEGADPTAAVKQRLRRHFGGSPLEARLAQTKQVETPAPAPAVRRIVKQVETDDAGNIVRVVEEHFD